MTKLERAGAVAAILTCVITVTTLVVVMIYARRVQNSKTLGLLSEVGLL
jgi:hypothetical protein